MKNLLLILSILLMAFTASAQTIVGGGGVIAISNGADPNVVPGIAAQDWTKGEATVAMDPFTNTMWRYNDGNAAGSKWVAESNGGSITAYTYDATTRVLTITEGGSNYTATLPLATGTDAGLLTAADFTKLSNITVTQPVDLDAMETDVADLTTLTGVASNATTTGLGTGTTLSDGTIVDNLQELETALELINGEATTVTDAANGIDIVETGDDITVDLDVNELATETTLDVAADFIPIYDASATTEVKTSINDISSAQDAALLYFVDDATATVATGREYLLAVGNIYGMPVGTPRIKQ